MKLSPLEALKAAVIEGEADEIRSLVENALNTGIEPNELTEKALTAAMNEVGVDFGAGRVFLPQVLLSAEAMRSAFVVLKENSLPLLVIIPRARWCWPLLRAMCTIWARIL